LISDTSFAYISFSIGLIDKPISGILVNSAPKPIGKSNKGSNFLVIDQPTALWIDQELY
jgi:hypothetical protein